MRNPTQGKLMKTVSFSVAYFFLVANLQAGLMVHDSRFVGSLRASTPTFPIQVDSVGNIYTVTSTAPNAELRRINTDNTVDSLTAVNAVIGVLADLEFGFNGDLFANATAHVRRFSGPSFSSAPFGPFNVITPDGGLAFDSANQIMWATGGNDLFGLNSSGSIVDTISGITIGGPSGLTIESSGDLLLLTRGGGNGAYVPEIQRINPTTHATQQLIDLSSLNLFMRGIDVSRTGEIFFSAGNQTTGEGFIYSVQSDGSNLTLIASHDGAQFSGIALGNSSDGSGRESIYFSADNQEIYELMNTAVPEPSTNILLLAGLLPFFMNA